MANWRIIMASKHPALNFRSIRKFFLYFLFVISVIYLISILVIYKFDKNILKELLSERSVAVDNIIAILTNNGTKETILIEFTVIWNYFASNVYIIILVFTKKYDWVYFHNCAAVIIILTSIICFILYTPIPFDGLGLIFFLIDTILFAGLLIVAWPIAKQKNWILN
jgi:hypothetical protein